MLSMFLFLRAAITLIHTQGCNWKASFQGECRAQSLQLSPVRLAKSLDHLVLLCQVDLDLLSQVEYGAVSRGAEHLLVQAALAPLALGPEPGEPLLHGGHAGDLLLVDLSLLWFAVLTHSLALHLEGDLAPDAGHLLLGERSHRAHLAGHHGLGQGVVTLQQHRLCLAIAQDWLKQPEQWF